MRSASFACSSSSLSPDNYVNFRRYIRFAACLGQSCKRAQGAFFGVEVLSFRDTEASGMPSQPGWKQRDAENPCIHVAKPQSRCILSGHMQMHVKFAHVQQPVASFSHPAPETRRNSGLNMSNRFFYAREELRWMRAVFWLGCRDLSVTTSGPNVKRE